MNRRNFLGNIAKTAAVAIVAPMTLTAASEISSKTVAIDVVNQGYTPGVWTPTGPLPCYCNFEFPYTRMNPEMNVADKIWNNMFSDEQFITK